MKIIESNRFSAKVERYKCHVEEKFPCLVVDTDEPIRGFLSYGQSWRCHSLPISNVVRLSSIGNGHAVALRLINAVDALPPVGIEFFAQHASDFINLSVEITTNGVPVNAAGNIGWSAAQHFAGFCEEMGAEPRTILDVCAASAGQSWSGLRPGGEVIHGGGITKPWDALLLYKAKAEEIADKRYKSKIRWEAISWTHGAYDDGYADLDGVTDYRFVLDSLMAVVDEADFNGDGSKLPIFMDQTAVLSSTKRQYENTATQLQFALDNPDRVHLIGPRYPYAFCDEVHHTGDAYFQIGELEAYIKHLVLDRGEAWMPFYIRNVKISRTSLVIELSAPPGFGDISLDATDLITLQPQRGFRLANLTDDNEVSIRDFAIEGSFVTATLSAVLDPRCEYEFSYAWIGPGAQKGESDAEGHTVKNGYSGIRGNVRRVGPASKSFHGQTVDTYLLASRHSIVPVADEKKKRSLFQKSSTDWTSQPS